MSEKFDYSKIEDYKGVIKAFSEISAVPRGSYFDRKISDYLRDFAKSLNLEVIQDEALNIIIRKPASKGMEDKPAVILQGHMDMVCVKDPGISHDFENEGLELMLDGEWLHANGTTLGADDGISIAYMMALLEDQSAVHPELICVVTTDEETGMEGAYALDFNKIGNVKYLLNMDSDIEGQCLCGCAGGLRLDGSLPVERLDYSGVETKITFSKLRGGHSGAEINKGITNAIRLMARALWEIESITDFGLVELSGGEKENAIPSFADAKIILPEDADFKAVSNKLEELADLYKTREPGLQLKLSFAPDKKEKALSKQSLDDLLFLLLSAPNGVQAMSAELEGLVETSLNLGIFELAEKEAKFNYSLRSSVSSEKKFLSRRVQLLFEKIGGSAKERNDYPAWEYKKDSKLRDIFVEAHKEVLGAAPEVTVIHAGLECGLFAEKKPELDMISFGPDMRDIHSSRERVNIPSVIRLFKVLEATLAKIN